MGQSYSLDLRARIVGTCGPGILAVTRPGILELAAANLEAGIRI